MENFAILHVRRLQNEREEREGNFYRQISNYRPVNHNLYANCMNGLEDKDLRYQCYIEQENNDIGAALELNGNKYLMQVYCLKVSFELLVARSSTRT